MPGNQPEDRIEAERHPGAGHAERAVEQHAPLAQRREGPGVLFAHGQSLTAARGTWQRPICRATDKFRARRMQRPSLIATAASTCYLTLSVPTPNMRVWPGAPYPLGRHLGRRRRQLRALLRARDPRRAVPVRLARRRSRIAHDSAAPSTPTWSGTAICPTSSRGSSTATASTARTRRTRATASIPHKLVMDPYAKVVGRTVRVGRLAVRLPHRRATTRRSTIATARRTRRSPRSSTPRSRGATTGRCARRGTRRSSTSCTSRASRS